MEFPLASQALSIVNQIRDPRARLATSAILMATVETGRASADLPLKGITACVRALDKLCELGVMKKQGATVYAFAADETTRQQLAACKMSGGHLTGIIVH